METHQCMPKNHISRSVSMYFSVANIVYTITFLFQFTTGLSYYSISINLGELTGDIFVNTFIAGGTELLSVIACVALMLHPRFARRKTVSLGLLLGGVGLITSTPFIVFREWDLEYLSIVFVMIGKFGITITYTGLFLYTVEIFPTTVRNLALGGCSMISGLGIMIAPYFGGPMLNVWTGLPNLLIGALTIVAGCTTLLLPETMGTKIPDTIEEAEEMAKATKQ